MQRVRAVTPQRNQRHIYRPSLMHLQCCHRMAKPRNRSSLQSTANERQTAATLPLQPGKPQLTELLQNKISADQKLPRGAHSKGISSLEKARSVNHRLSAQKNVLFASLWRSKTRREISFLYGWLNHKAILTSFSCKPSTHNYLNSCCKGCMG